MVTFLLIVAIFYIYFSNLERFKIRPCCDNLDNNLHSTAYLYKLRKTSLSTFKGFQLKLKPQEFKNSHILIFK